MLESEDSSEWLGPLYGFGDSPLRNGPIGFMPCEVWARLRISSSGTWLGCASRAPDLVLNVTHILGSASLPRFVCQTSLD